MARPAWWHGGGARVDLVQIRYFLALADTLNFTRAAERCNVTQPALTRSIQRLEDELGGPLLLRERALTQLTELGRAMLPLLERTYAAAEEARSRAKNLRHQVTAPLRLGLCTLVTAAVLVPVLKELAARFADRLQLTLVHGACAHLAELLLHGELDAALLPEAEIEAERLNRWPLFEDGLVVLASPTTVSPCSTRCPSPPWQGKWCWWARRRAARSAGRSTGCVAVRAWRWRSGTGRRAGRASLIWSAPVSASRSRPGVSPPRMA